MTPEKLPYSAFRPIVDIPKEWSLNNPKLKKLIFSTSTIKGRRGVN